MYIDQLSVADEDSYIHEYVSSIFGPLYTVP